jgi:hypothetical protein
MGYTQLFLKEVQGREWYKLTIMTELSELNKLFCLLINSAFSAYLSVLWHYLSFFVHLEKSLISEPYELSMLAQ